MRQLPQTLQEDELAALSRAEICERLPRVRDGARAVALHGLVRVPCGSSLRADSGAASGPVSVFTVVVAIVVFAGTGPGRTSTTALVKDVNRAITRREWCPSA